MFLRYSYFFGNLSLNVLINMVLTQIKECNDTLTNNHRELIWPDSSLPILVESILSQRSQIHEKPAPVHKVFDQLLMALRRRRRRFVAAGVRGTEDAFGAVKTQEESASGQPRAHEVINGVAAGPVTRYRGAGFLTAIADGAFWLEKFMENG